MDKPSETAVLQRICREAKAGGRVSDAHLRQLRAAFGPRFARAWEALREGRVKKYVFKPSGRVVWIVVGRERDYLLMPAADFCPCDDFYYRVMDREAHLCYHLIAQKMAEALSRYDSVEAEDGLYETLMGEWRRVAT